jgi:hypothetical protein
MMMYDVVGLGRLASIQKKEDEELHDDAEAETDNQIQPEIISRNTSSRAEKHLSLGKKGNEETNSPR